jgi:hypothetical protein
MKRIAEASLYISLFLAASAPAAEMEAWSERYPKEYQEWRDSVHGSVYLSGDTDAPGCTDCHGDPEESDIRTSAFRLSIPSICANCHDDAQLMLEREIRTDVYASYLVDFHGATIDYYHTQDPSTWRYEAVCSDCHGSHAVYRVSDARSSVASANLLKTCQGCHPGADAGFASIGSGHFRTDRESSLLTYAVARIYQVLIPAVIGLMAAYVGLDIVHRLRKRFAGLS